jgi:hypothetical protein
MSKNFRSKFELMILKQANTEGKVAMNIGGNVSTWLQELYPSKVIALSPDIVQDQFVEVNDAQGINGNILNAKAGRMYKKRFDTELSSKLL